MSRRQSQPDGRRHDTRDIDGATSIGPHPMLYCTSDALRRAEAVFRSLDLSPAPPDLHTGMNRGALSSRGHTGLHILAALQSYFAGTIIARVKTRSSKI
jgi:hypothetical protein